MTLEDALTKIRQLEGLLERALDRIKVLEDELKKYVTRDEDKDMWSGASWHSIIVPNRRILHSRALLGLGHMANPEDPLGTH